MQKIPITLLCCLLIISACIQAGELAVNNGAPVVVNICVPKAPPALPVLRMVELGAMRGRADLNIHVWNGAEQLVAMVQDGHFQLFGVPLTVAAALYNKGAGIRLTNVNTWGIAYFVTSDPDFRDWVDLRGKTLFVQPRSSTPDAVTRFFLQRAGLKPGRDLKVVNTAAPELGQLLRVGRVVYAVATEPQLTAAMRDNPALRVAFRFEDKWKEIMGPDANIPSAGFAAGDAFITAHPDLIREFEREYAKALEWVLEHPEEAGELAARHLGLKAEVIAAAVPRLGLLYRDAPAAKRDMKDLLQILLESAPETIGRKIPDAGFYWK